MDIAAAATMAPAIGLAASTTPGSGLPVSFMSKVQHAFDMQDYSFMTDKQLLEMCGRLHSCETWMAALHDQLHTEKAKLLKQGDTLRQQVLIAEAHTSALLADGGASLAELRSCKTEQELITKSDGIELSVPEELVAIVDARGEINLSWFFDERLLDHLEDRDHPLQSLSFQVRQQTEGLNGCLRTRIHDVACSALPPSRSRSKSPPQRGGEVGEQKYQPPGCIPGRPYTFSVRACARYRDEDDERISAFCTAVTATPACGSLSAAAALWRQPSVIAKIGVQSAATVAATPPKAPLEAKHSDTIEELHQKFQMPGVDVNQEYLQRQQQDLEKARKQLEEEKAGFAANMDARQRAFQACRAGDELWKRLGGTGSLRGTPVKETPPLCAETSNSAASLSSPVRVGIQEAMDAVALAPLQAEAACSNTAFPEAATAAEAAAEAASRRLEVARQRFAGLFEGASPAKAMLGCTQDIGKKIHVMSPTKHLRECIIVNANEKEVKIHYSGFDEAFDEWLPARSERIQQARNDNQEFHSALKFYPTAMDRLQELQKQLKCGADHEAGKQEDRNIQHEDRTDVPASFQGSLHDTPKTSTRGNTLSPQSRRSSPQSQATEAAESVDTNAAFSYARKTSTNSPERALPIEAPAHQVVLVPALDSPERGASLLRSADLAKVSPLWPGDVRVAETSPQLRSGPADAANEVKLQPLSDVRLAAYQEAVAASHASEGLISKCVASPDSLRSPNSTQRLDWNQVEVKAQPRFESPGRLQTQTQSSLQDQQLQANPVQNAPAMASSQMPVCAQAQAPEWLQRAVLPQPSCSQKEPQADIRPRSLSLHRLHVSDSQAQVVVANAAARSSLPHPTRALQHAQQNTYAQSTGQTQSEMPSQLQGQAQHEMHQRSLGAVRSVSPHPTQRQLRGISSHETQEHALGLQQEWLRAGSPHPIQEHSSQSQQGRVRAVPGHLIQEHSVQSQRVVSPHPMQAHLSQSQRVPHHPIREHSMQSQQDTCSRTVDAQPLLVASPQPNGHHCGQQSPARQSPQPHVSPLHTQTAGIHSQSPRRSLFFQNTGDAHHPQQVLGAAESREVMFTIFHPETQPGSHLSQCDTAATVSTTDRCSTAPGTPGKMVAPRNIRSPIPASPNPRSIKLQPRSLSISSPHRRLLSPAQKARLVGTPEESLKQNGGTVLISNNGVHANLNELQSLLKEFKSHQACNMTELQRQREGSTIFTLPTSSAHSQSYTPMVTVPVPVPSPVASTPGRGLGSSTGNCSLEAWMQDRLRTRSGSRGATAAVDNSQFATRGSSVPRVMAGQSMQQQQPQRSLSREPLRSLPSSLRSPQHAGMPATPSMAFAFSTNPTTPLGLAGGPLQPFARGLPPAIPAPPLSTELAWLPAAHAALGKSMQPQDEAELPPPPRCAPAAFNAPTEQPPAAARLAPAEPQGQGLPDACYNFPPPPRCAPAASNLCWTSSSVPGNQNGAGQRRSGAFEPEAPLTQRIGYGSSCDFEHEAGLTRTAVRPTADDSFAGAKQLHVLRVQLAEKNGGWESFSFSVAQSLEQQAVMFLRQHALKTAFQAGLIQKMQDMVSSGQRHCSADIVDLI